MSQPIRVLHILQRMEAGGTQALLMNIYRKIDRTKIQFDFLVIYPEKCFYDDEVFKLGGKIYYSSFREDLNIFKFVSFLNSFFRLHKEYKIVHVHAYTFGYFCLKSAKYNGVPVRIAHSHSNSITNDFKKLIKIPLKKIYLKHATDFMACSEEAGNFLFKNRQFIVLNNAIDSKKFIFSTEKRNAILKELHIEDKFVVGHVGRFKPEKNHNFLLKIFTEIIKVKNNSILLLVGDGPLKQDIIIEAKKKNINDKIIFLENRSDMDHIYSAMDVFVFPSIYEGLGISAIEAQASGIPTICSDGLPSEANISPLFYSVSLKENEEYWSKIVLDASNNKYKYCNMQKYILDSGYDLSQIVKFIQEYYLEKYNENGDN